MVKKKRQTEKKEPESGQRMRKRIWFVAIAILIVAIGCYFLSKFQTVDEQLAAIEAARKIPDAENAAIIYNQLLENYDKSALSPDFLDEDLDYLTRLEPWLSKDYPELAEWLKDQQDIISTLLEASEKEKCRFPIITDPQQMSAQMDRIYAMHRWSFLLKRAANNDIGEGRIDDAIEKWRCLIQMGNHQCQQPVMVDYLFGIVVEALALDRIKSLILQSDATEAHLKTIEAAIPHTKDNWTEISSKIIEFETLYERKNVSFFNRVRYWRLWRGFGSKEDYFDRIREHYLRQLANRRGNKILIALRRYRNKNDRWPESLDVIQTSPQAEIFVDPFNNGPFVYKLTDDSFKLYSKGLNNIDEDVKYQSNSLEKAEPDDWLIWPPSSRKTKNEKADAQQSSTQKDVVK